jgi:hypothetical protein
MWVIQIEPASKRLVQCGNVGTKSHWAATYIQVLLIRHFRNKCHKDLRNKARQDRTLAFGPDGPLLAQSDIGALIVTRWTKPLQNYRELRGLTIRGKCAHHSVLSSCGLRHAL